MAKRDIKLFEVFTIVEKFCQRRVSYLSAVSDAEFFQKRTLFDQSTEIKVWYAQFAQVKIN